MMLSFDQTADLFRYLPIYFNPFENLYNIMLYSILNTFNTEQFSHLLHLMLTPFCTKPIFYNPVSQEICHA